MRQAETPQQAPSQPRPEEEPMSAVKPSSPRLQILSTLLAGLALAAALASPSAARANWGFEEFGARFSLNGKAVESGYKGELSRQAGAHADFTAKLTFPFIGDAIRNVT